jgi:DNA-binding NarL/FixJ family response regulator
MDFDLLVYAGIAAVLVLLFLMIYLKDSESQRKFTHFERTIEELMQQNHQLRREILQLEKAEKNKLDAFEAKFHNMVQEEINTHVLPLLNSLKEIENVIQNFQEEHQDRLAFLEERTKSINRFASPSASSNEKQVIALYKEGKKEHEIAKELRLGLGEVQFILKMNYLK